MADALRRYPAEAAARCHGYGHGNGESARAGEFARAVDSARAGDSPRTDDCARAGSVAPARVETRQPAARLIPLDQADGLRRLFAQPHICLVPVVSNPNVAFGGVMLERLCTAFGEHGRHTLVIDAAERASEPSELALLDLADCIEPLARNVSYLAARGLPLRFVDATGSTAPFLQAVTEAAPECDVLLIHASAAELCRMFGRHAGHPVRPLLLADDRPASVTHAFAAMKLLTQRAGLVVHDLLLGAAAHSPRSERIALQLAACAEDFLGAVLRDWVRVDPACDATEAPSPELRRLVRGLLQSAQGEPAAALHPAQIPATRLPGRVPAAWTLN